MCFFLDIRCHLLSFGEGKVPPKKRWHLGWWKDFFISFWLGSSWRLGIEFEENIPKTLKLEGKSRMETNVVFPGLEGAWTEILPKIGDVKIVPGKAVTTCRWSHRSGDHQQLFQKVSRITIPKKGHPKVTSRIARLCKWSCPFFEGRALLIHYITYQNAGRLFFLHRVFVWVACIFWGVFLPNFHRIWWIFQGEKREFMTKQTPVNHSFPKNPPPKELEEFLDGEEIWRKKWCFFCVFQLNPRSPKKNILVIENINEEIRKQILT